MKNVLHTLNLHFLTAPYKLVPAAPVGQVTLHAQTKKGKTHKGFDRYVFVSCKHNRQVG